MHHVVAVRDLQSRARKFPRDRLPCFMQLIGDLFILSPFLNSLAVRPDGVKRHQWRWRRRPDIFPDLTVAAATALPAWPSA
jgi:hypothetical protein